jgi:acetylornithine deacetylase/succinyl-diaminopimelate desuccinylase-like protein
MTAWQEYLDQNQARFTDELLDFLRIPSISALPAHKEDVQRAAEWVAARLSSAGIEHVEVLPTGGHPVVYGDWLHAPGKPTILIYGHFDTQPADPLELWESAPFEPVIKDGKVYARGASDDKGNMFAPILAVEALLKSEGALPVNLKFFLEGQEEIGSPTIEGFLAQEQERERFACDLVLSADGGQWDEGQGTILEGLRGNCGLQIDVKSANSDLHSGMHGGAIPNAIHELVNLLHTLRTPEGAIAVEGFYDDVVPLTEEARARIAAVPFDEEVYMDELGLVGLVGEPGYSSRERMWARPTLELNGIWGGFQGAGSKTVIPNEAHAKITCRLVANQNPRKIVDLLIKHIETHAPKSVTVSISGLKYGSDAYLMDGNHPGNQAVRDVLVEMYGKEPYYVRSGGSIPVCALFQKYLGSYTASFGFGLGDENLHAPNEFFRLESFEKGQVGYCKLLHRLSSYQPE